MDMMITITASTASCLSARPGGNIDANRSLISDIMSADDYNSA